MTLGRSAVSARLTVSGRVADLPSNFNPNSISDLWIMDPANSTLGTTPTATGTTPPVVTLSGALTIPYGLRVEIQTTGALGASTFRVSINNGSTYVASGVTTIATYTVPGTSVVLNFPSGSYTNDNVYRSTVGTGRDASGLGRDASMATPANQPFFTSANASFNNNPTWDTPNATATSLDTGLFSAITQAATYIWVGVTTSASAQYMWHQVPPNTAARSVLVFGGNAFSPFSTAGATIPGYPSRPTILVIVWDGSFIRFYQNGNLLRVSADGLAAVTSLRLFNLSSGAFPFIGSVADFRIIGRAISASERRSVIAYFSAKHNIPIATST